jgi:hypothetical protein
MPPSTKQRLKESSVRQVTIERELLERWRDAFAEELSAYDIEPPIQHVKQSYDEICAALQDAPAQPAQGLTDDRQPLTKVLSAVCEYLPPNGITAKALPAKPLIAMKDVEISLMAHNEDPGDWNDLHYRDCWIKGFETGARSIEEAHGIQKGQQS